MNYQEIFLGFFGTGRLPSPVLSATLAAWLCGAGLLLGLGAESLFTLAFAFFLIAVFEINKFQTRTDTHDESFIVIDEAVGVWVSLTVSSYGLRLLAGLPFALYLMLAAALGSFLLFRYWAPSTIGWIRRNIKGGLGIMLDDVLAGFAAGILNLLLFKAAAFFPSAF